MATPIADRLDRALQRLPLQYSGPGGAVAVLREGEVLARHSWGWADVERRIPFTPETMFLACSITKQFTCATLLDHFPDPTVLDADLRARLPNLLGEMPGVLDLAHNQSGLRDYWAQTVLCGSPVEARFDQGQSDRLIARTRSLHFAPGTRNSYVNQNFRLISEMIEARTGHDFATLLRTGILDRAGMPHARLNPDTSSVPGGTLGYEGSVEDGFRPAVNNIVWTGDAGLSVCLDDMIAWERFIDATRGDADGIYNRLSAPQRFRDGAPAGYGFGLGRGTMLGRIITSHGGGLRGWRSTRLNAPGERISVVVLFNHMADPRDAAQELFAALLDEPAVEPFEARGDLPTGRFQDPESGLVVRLEAAPDRTLRLRFGTNPETLVPSAAGWAGGASQVRVAPDGVWLDRASENLSSRLMACEGEPDADFAGVYHCAELDADFTCVDAGGVLFGAFSGDLGLGLMEMLQPYATDLWLYPCPRALDSGAPGDWTVQVLREAGRVVGVRVGCWLARGLVFARR
jgi:D-aminopeptidase